MSACSEVPQLQIIRIIKESIKVFLSSILFVFLYALFYFLKIGKEALFLAIEIKKSIFRKSKDAPFAIFFILLNSNS